jgi:uncharacterized protein (TIGR03118 family)
LAVTSAVALAGLALASSATAAPSDRYVIHNVWSNNFTTWPADVLDTRLVNPWGLAASATSPWWPVNNGSNTSTINSAAGGAVNTGTLANLPVPTGGVAGAGGTNFQVTPPGGTAGASNFIFSSMNGGIYGWRGGLPGNNAIQAFSKPGAFYTGLAIATVAGSPRLFATDYRQARIDVVSNTWQALPDAFVDPNLPAGYSPWGIQTIGNRVYVAYARQTAPLNPNYHAGIGAGFGVVDAFDLSGTFVSRVASPGGALNAPWGLALAPTNFGAYGGDLLVGNFGDGKINAYHENADGTWTQSGTLKNTDGSALVLPGLWALEPGNGAAGNGQRYHVYYTAGGADERSGVLGRIAANPGDVSGTVPATLSLAMGTPAAFGAFTPGVARDYTASTTANVISSAGDATLSVADPSTTDTGKLVNGAFALAQPVQVNATSPGGGTGGALAALGGSANPNTLITYSGPISNDMVTVNFKQSIGSNDPLRTGSYSKTLTFTLSTTTP